MQRIRLPIDDILPDALAVLERERCLVLQASPGSGKTTRLPPALLKAAFTGGKKEVLVLEPRRLAAKLAATRVAFELGENVGETVGYQFRFERVGGPKTRLRFFTEGMLLRRLLSDPRLDNVAAVVLDEFHERHLQGDIALAYLRQLQSGVRPDLRLVVMSATLDTATVAHFLGDCRTLKVEAPIHPIDVQHAPGPLAVRLEQAVKDTVGHAIKTDRDARGDILVFLPGMGEIRRAETALAPFRDSCRIHVLHGELSKEEQERAVTPGDKRKIILSTNVAESSLTIEGVTTVVDSGLHRIAAYSWWTGVPSLRTRPISRASAIQRAGRAGRTGPGRCFRLFSKHEFDTRPSFETPEIQRADISQTLLELKALGLADESSFPWFEAPSAQALDSARTLLFRLGALATAQPGAALTALGRKMAAVPAAPRLSRLLLEAHRRGVADHGAKLAALISEGELSDAGLDALEGLERAQVSERVRRQFANALPNERNPRPADWRSELALSALAAFPDRVARRRGTTGTLLLSAGGSATVERPTDLDGAEFYLTLEAQEMQGLGQARATLKVRSLCPIEPEWLLELEPVGPVEEQEMRWENGKVAAYSRLRYDQLTLEESAAEPKDKRAAARVLWKAGLGIDPDALRQLSPSDWVAKLAPVCDAEQMENAIARLFLLQKHLPEALEGRVLADAMETLVEGHLSLSALRDVAWEEELAGALAPQHLRRLEEWLPRSLTLPGGRKTKVHYRLDRDPWVESRLQDFFGMGKGPTILGGKLPLTIHLLAPNGRAVQVTTDLSGFWERAYPPLRKELGRKYPRHSWPEDPRHAEPPKPRPKRY